jgi:hypothetical protein
VHHTIFAEAFDGRYRAAIGLHGKHSAALDRFAIEMNGACSTTRCVATDIGASELQLIAQKMYEQSAWLYVIFLLGAIDGDADLHTVSFYSVISL